MSQLRAPHEHLWEFDYFIYHTPTRVSPSFTFVWSCRCHATLTRPYALRRPKAETLSDEDAFERRQDAAERKRQRKGRGGGPHPPEPVLESTDTKVRQAFDPDWPERWKEDSEYAAAAGITVAP